MAARLRACEVFVIARKFYVSGRVQGVGFRWFVQRAADGLDLGGYVRNMHDGRVEVWAEGPEADVEAMRARLEEGPRWADVVAVEQHEMRPRGDFAGFSITY